MAADERDVPVTEELMQELRRYRTVRTVGKWPLVTGTAQRLLDAYTTYKKEGELAGAVLGAWEGLAAVGCSTLVLPVIRTPLVRIPLQAADTVTDAGARLLQRAMPQVKDKKVTLDAGLVLRLLFLPLTMSLALAHNVLESASATLVKTFPRLQRAAKGFEERTLVGQCVALWVMTVLVLPAQLLIPSIQKALQLASSVYNRTVVRAWSWSVSAASSAAAAARDLLVQAVVVATSLPELALHALKEAAALARKYAARALQFLRDQTSGAFVAVQQKVAYVIGLALGVAQAVYHVVFETSGLRVRLQHIYEAIVAAVKQLATSAQKTLGSVKDGAPVAGLVRRIRLPSPAGTWFSTSAGSGGAPAAAPAEGSGRSLPHQPGSTGAVCRPTRPEKPDTWSPRRLSTALMLTLSVVVALLVLMATHCL